MIITDDIRNKQYIPGHFMDNHLSKTSFEYQALATLKYCFPNKYASLCHSEAPDLQDRNGNLAVEVTNAISEKDAKVNGEFVKLEKAQYQLFLDELDPIALKELERSREKILQNGGSIFSDNMLTAPLQSDMKEEDVIKTSLREKLAKVEVYREQGFTHLELFMWYTIPILFGTPDEWMGWLYDMQPDYKAGYETIFIYHVDALSVFDMKNRTIQNVVVPIEDKRAICNLGRMAAEGEIKDDDQLWN